VAIGASLDAEGSRAELMRKGTVWDDIVANRKRMLEVCPQVDSYISATVGLSNCLHVLDFHKNWVEQGLIKPQDFNFNLLQYPLWQRMDLLPQEEKDRVTEKYKEHIEWLKSQDHLTRASKGFESALDWMNKKDMSRHLPTFVEETRKYDKIRDENFTDVFPEWKELFAKYEKN
jgi:hypothetical protein